MNQPDGEIEVLAPAALSNLPGITAGFTLRHGGVSEGPFQSLNLGFSTGDESDLVLENRRRLFRSRAIDVTRLAIAGQVHGSEILEVSDPGLYPGYDALVTSERDLTLCITAADCAVVLLADPEAGIIAAAHSGWRGTVAEIASKTVDRMTKLGAQTERIRAYVSPCISADQFEVGPEVAEQFDASYVIPATSSRKPHVDLKAAIRDQLLDRGLASDAVDVSPRCTFTETQHFFSYRAERTTGRMMGFICLKND